MNYRSILQCFLVLVLAANSAFAGAPMKTFIGADSTDFSDDDNWSPTGVPVANDNIIISVPCTIDSAMNDALQYGSLSFSSGSASLSWTDNSKVFKITLVDDSASAVGATLNMTGGGTLQLTGSGTSLFDVSNIVFTNGTGTIEYASTDNQTVSGENYNNLKLSGNRGFNMVSLGTGSIGVKGAIDTSTLSSDLPFVIDPVTSTVVYNGTGSQTVAAIPYFNLTVTNARVATPTVFFESDPMPGSPFAKEIIIRGALTLDASGLNWDPQQSTLVFEGMTPQTVPTAAGFDYYRLVLANQATPTPTVTFTNGMTYRIRADLFAAPATYVTTNTTFDFKGTGLQFIDAFPFHNLTISGNNSNTTFNTGVVSIANTFLVTASPVSYNFTPLNIIDYNGETSQTILPLPYASLAISGDKSNDTVTFSPGTTSISGSFAVTATGTPPPVYVTTGTTIQFNGNSTTQTIPGAFQYETLTLSGTAQKEVGIASVVTGTLNMNGTTLVVQPSLNMTTGVLNGGAGASISFVNDTAGLAINGTANSAYTGNFQGDGSISKSGLGTLALSTASTIYTGDVNFTGGTLEISNGSALGNAGGAGTLTMVGTPTLVINNSALSNEVNCSAGSPVIRCGATSACKVSMISAVALELETTGPGDQFTVLLQSSSPSCTTEFKGPGNLLLQDNPTIATHYDGTLDISGGYVRLDSATSLGKSTSNTVVGVAARLASNTSTAIPQGITLNGGSLQVTGGDDRKYAGNIFLTAPSNIILNDAANGMQARSIEIATLNRGGSALSVSGPAIGGNPPFPPPPVLKITGAQTGGGSMTIAQNAEVALSGTGNLSSTVVNVNAGGILTASNTVVNSMVAVNLSTGGTLRGNGEFSGASSVSSTGGTILPGPVMGTGILPLTAPTTLTLDGTSQVVFRAGAPGTNDRINVGGMLTLDGLLNIAPLAGFGPGTYTLFQHGGLTNNTIDLPPAPPGLSFALDTTTMSNEVRLIVTALPITVDSPASITALKGSDVDYTLAATGPSAPPIQFSTTALPPGLRVENGKIVGKPTVPGSYTFTITATNGVTTSTLLVSVTISEVNSITFTSFSAEGKVGSAFFVDLAGQVGNLSGVTFTTAAPLPEGLKLSGSVISGTPKAAGQSVVTITATKTAFTSGTGTLTLTILAKTETVGAQLSDLLVDPEEPGINELVLFSINAFSPENLVTTVSWDFGDGSTATGEFVEKTYTSAGTYTVTVTATAGGKTTTQTQQIVVSSIDPNAPVINEVNISPTPSLTGQTVNLNVSASDINNDALTYEWNFGDGSAPVAGSAVSYTYNTAGEYLVTVKATDATGLTSRTVERTHFVGDGAGIPNLLLNSKVISFDGVGQTISFSEDGLIGLTIDVDSLTRDLLETKTDFGLTNFRSVAGDSPVVKVQTSGLRVAKTTVREKATRKERGKARKTLAVSAREVGEPAKVETEPEDKGVSKLKMKGDFFPSRGGAVSGTLSRATKDDVAKADKLTASGSITMPGGLDMTNGTEVEIALGNIIDKVAIDAKGKGKGRFTTLQMRIKTDKTTKKSVGDVAAKFSIKMSVADMVADGFDTEGVVVSKEQNGKPLSIQAALMIGGVVYTADNPVTLKVSPKEDKAQMISRSGAAN